MAWSFSLRGSSFALRPSEAGDTGVKFSFAEDNFLFKKALKDYIHGQWDMSRSLPVTARTPILYQRLDLADKGFRVKNYPITIPPHVIKKPLENWRLLQQGKHIISALKNWKNFQIQFIIL